MLFRCCHVQFDSHNRAVSKRCLCTVEPRFTRPNLPGPRFTVKRNFPRFRKLALFDHDICSGHPDLPDKTLSPEHPGKSGSDCIGMWLYCMVCGFININVMEQLFSKSCQVLQSFAKLYRVIANKYDHTDQNREMQMISQYPSVMGKIQTITHSSGNAILTSFVYLFS